MTMHVRMTLIFCSQRPAEALSSYRAQPDCLFRCLACGHLLDARDLVLDPAEEWIVSPHGLLGYTVDEPEAVAYGLDGAFAAVHRGAELVLNGLTLSLSEGCAVTIAVCAILTTLETRRDAGRCDPVLLRGLGAGGGGAFRMGVKSAAPEHTCPVCGERGDPCESGLGLVRERGLQMG